MAPEPSSSEASLVPLPVIGLACGTPLLASALGSASKDAGCSKLNKIPNNYVSGVSSLLHLRPSTAPSALDLRLPPDWFEATDSGGESLLV